MLIFCKESDGFTLIRYDDGGSAHNTLHAFGESLVPHVKRRMFW